MEDISASDPADTPAKLHFNRTELSSVVNTRCSVTWREPSVCACATMSVCGHKTSAASAGFGKTAMAKARVMSARAARRTGIAKRDGVRTGAPSGRTNAAAAAFSDARDDENLPKLARVPTPAASLPKPARTSASAAAPSASRNASDPSRPFLCASAPVASMRVSLASRSNHFSRSGRALPFLQ